MVIRVLSPQEEAQRTLFRRGAPKLARGGGMSRPLVGAGCLSLLRERERLSLRSWSSVGGATASPPGAGGGAEADAPSA